MSMTQKANTTSDDSSSSHYDCIVVGAGTSAMGFLRALLENDDDDHHHLSLPNKKMWRVAVLEQGSRHNIQKTPRLLDWYQTAHGGASSRQYTATHTSSRRRIPVPCGQGRGGTTRINAGLCCTTTTTWESSTANSSAATRDTPHENDSPPTTASPGEVAEAMQHLQSVLRQNGVFQSHPVPMIVDPINGKRMDFYQGLVEPLLSSTQQKVQVHWYDGVTCQRILYSKDQVTGVEYTTSDQHCEEMRKLYAPRVMLAAGVLGSPVVLAASGLLDTQQHGVLPLQDHVMIPAAYWKTGRKNKTTNPMLEQQQESCCWNGVRHMDPPIPWKDYHTFQVSEMHVSVFPVILPTLAVQYVFGRAACDHWYWLTKPAARTINFLLYLLIAWTPLYWVLEHWVKVVCVFMVRSPIAFNGSFSIQRKKHDKHVVKDIRLDYMQSEADLVAVQEFWEQYLDPYMFRQACWEWFPGTFFRRGYRLGNPLHMDRFRFFCQQFCLPYFHWCGSLTNILCETPLPAGLHVCDASTLHPLPPFPPALTLAARGYVLGRSLRKKG